MLDRYKHEFKMRQVLKKPTGEYLATLPEFIRQNFTSQNVTQGLNELLNSEADRDFVKNKLIDKTVAYIKMWVDMNKPQR